MSDLEEAKSARDQLTKQLGDVGYGNFRWAALL